MREKYETLSLATLKDLAKARGLKGVSGMKKAELIERMLEEDERDRQAVPEETKSAARTEHRDRGEQHRQMRLTEDNVKELSANTGDREIHDIDRLDSGVTAHGILEVMPDGYGFIRCENYLPGDNDVYVSPVPDPQV